MRVGNFSVLIPEGVERDSGHVALEHGRQYTLRLLNHDHRRCDAEVTVDGKPVGGFRLHGGGSVTLERFPDDPGRLTFYSTGTWDAAAAGESAIAAPDKGLIQVRFVPERRPVYTPPPVPTTRRFGAGGQSVSGQGLLRSAPMDLSGGGEARCFAGAAEEKTSGGITGLSGHSAQQFVTVADIDRAEDEAVTISLRLITLVGGPRPLQPARHGNPVPAPVS